MSRVVHYTENRCGFCGGAQSEHLFVADGELAAICQPCAQDAMCEIAAHARRLKPARKPKRHTTRTRVIERDKGLCRYCGTLVDGRLHIDHVVPYSLGGKTDTDNLVTACSACNLAKGQRTPEQAGMSLLEVPQ